MHRHGARCTAAVRQCRIQKLSCAVLATIGRTVRPVVSRREGVSGGSRSGERPVPQRPPPVDTSRAGRLVAAA